MRRRSLYLYVLSQLELLDLGQAPGGGAFLVESLNQNGWLDRPLEDLAVQMGKPLDLAARALEIVQSLEPAGGGGQDPLRMSGAPAQPPRGQLDWQSGSPRTIWTPSAESIRLHRQGPQGHAGQVYGL